MRYPASDPFDQGVVEVDGGHQIFWERVGNPRDVPAVFVRGRLDIASPLGVIWRLAKELPRATLHVVEHEGHGGADTTDNLLVQATNQFAE